MGCVHISHVHHSCISAYATLGASCVRNTLVTEHAALHIVIVMHAVQTARSIVQEINHHS